MNTEHRLARLKQLIDWHGGQAKLADALDVTPGYISQLKTKRRPFTEKTARLLEKTLALPPLWFDINDSADKNLTEPSPDAYYQNEPKTRTGKTKLTITHNTVPVLNKTQIINRDFGKEKGKPTQWIGRAAPTTKFAFAFNTSELATETDRYGYEDNTTVYVDPEKPYKNGQPVLIADTHGTLAIRHVEQIGEAIYLCTKNPAHGRIELNDSIIIIGAIAGTQKTYP